MTLNMEEGQGGGRREEVTMRSSPCYFTHPLASSRQWKEIQLNDECYKMLACYVLTDNMNTDQKKGEQLRYSPNFTYLNILSITLRS